MHVDYASRREGKTLDLTNGETKYKKTRYSHLIGDSMDRWLGSDSEAFFGIPIPVNPRNPTILFVIP